MSTEKCPTCGESVVIERTRNIGVDTIFYRSTATETIKELEATLKRQSDHYATCLATAEADLRADVTPVLRAAMEWNATRHELMRARGEKQHPDIIAALEHRVSNVNIALQNALANCRTARELKDK